MSRVTKRLIDSIKPPDKGEAIYWDDELKGFAVRVFPSGTKSYLVHYRTRSGRQRKMSLGRHGVLTPVADECIKRYASRKKRGFGDIRIIQNGVSPKWGGIPAREIGRRDVVRCMVWS